jgi:trehalose synthase
MAKLIEYEPIVGKQIINELYMLAGHLHGKRVQNINSTAVGGGVAEILHRMMPLLQELGVEATWDVIHGGEKFFWVTKKIHNGLHGASEEMTTEMVETFWETSRENLDAIKCDADIVFVHDPQPIALIEQRAQWKNKWLWRCHVDVSHPAPEIWKFLHSFIVQYDTAVFSAPQFSQVLPIPQALISPSIDPLAEKNRELKQDEIDDVLHRFKLKSDKPMITQVSRFDFLKDPVGVIKAFKMVRKSVDCQLVLAGGTATDDPESDVVLNEVKKEADGDPDVHVLTIPPGSDLEINALQRASAVVIQKSIREGFGLTVSEALWKGRPMVASAVGGIPLQIKHRFSGLLCHSIEGAALAIKQLLNNRDYAAQLGENGREQVRAHHLLTNHLKDYLLLFLSLEHLGKDIVHL